MEYVVYQDLEGWNQPQLKLAPLKPGSMGKLLKMIRKSCPYEVYAGCLFTHGKIINIFEPT